MIKHVLTTVILIGTFQRMLAQQRATPQLCEFIFEDSVAAEQAKSKLEGDALQHSYQWKNHLMVMTGDDFASKKELPKFKSAETKKYKSPLYFFDYSERCGRAYTANQWTYFVLTANLVEDKAKQKEYVAYHDTQFEEWPEIANGFCNATFQQLMVYKTKRQLMLLIVVPEGKTLAELDPLTVKDNPRVADWNKIMAGYQEGIPGTDENEVWVFLDPLAD